MCIRNKLINFVDYHVICNLKSSFERLASFQFQSSLVPFLGLASKLSVINCDAKSQQPSDACFPNVCQVYML